ncbi:hypothetical protein BSNK01_02550 [Bacillaceae bacterium]
MGKIEQAIQDIERVSREMIALVRQQPEPVIRWKPQEDVWSIMEILCHVEEAVPYWLEELKNTVSSPGREWGRGLQDEGRLAAVARAPERSLEDVLAGIEKGAALAREILGSLKDDDLTIEAPSRNPRFGTKPMAFIVDHLLVEHVEKHLGQIERNLRQYEAAQNDHQ